jgi:hypothetical protein
VTLEEKKNKERLIKKRLGNLPRFHNFKEVLENPFKSTFTNSAHPN